MTNRVRGEVEVEVDGQTYVLRPEHGRAVRLDDALRRGILGTLVDSTTNVVKVRDMALVIHHLADDAPKVDDLMKAILRSNLYQVGIRVAQALAHVAAGSEPEGESDGQSDQTTGSTGATD